MKKEDLWQLYLTRNPDLCGTGTITLSKINLRKFFDLTYDQAHSMGIKNGRALAMKEEKYFNIAKERLNL